MGNLSNAMGNLVKGMTDSTKARQSSLRKLFSALRKKLSEDEAVRMETAKKFLNTVFKTYKTMAVNLMERLNENKEERNSKEHNRLVLTRKFLADVRLAIGDMRSDAYELFEKFRAEREEIIKADLKTSRDIWKNRLDTKEKNDNGGTEASVRCKKFDGESATQK